MLSEGVVVLLLAPRWRHKIADFEEFSGRGAEALEERARVIVVALLGLSRRRILDVAGVGDYESLDVSASVSSCLLRNRQME